MYSSSPKTKRIEFRPPDPLANPYLAFAATIAAGLYGIERKLKAPEIYNGNAYLDDSLPQVPLTLSQAIQKLEENQAVKRLLGNEVVEHYLHAAKVEQSHFDRNVTDLELIRGFERL